MKEREKEKEEFKKEKMKMIKDRINKKSNLTVKSNNNINSNYSYSSNDFNRVPIDKRKKLSLNLFQLKNAVNENYYINNKDLIN